MTDQEIVGKMQEHIGRRGFHTANGPTLYCEHDGGSQAAIPDSELQELENLVKDSLARSLLIGSINPRPKGLHNELIQFLKKIIRRCLTWYMRPVQESNLALVRALQRLVFLQHQHIFLVQRLESAQQQLSAELQEFRQMHVYETLQHQETVLRRLEYQLANPSANVRVPTDSHMATVPTNGATKLPELSFDYAGFQERYRGSETLIKQRQRAYLKYFVRHEPVMDLGSGRGEFLELLRELGIAGIGVETNLDAILLCREKGLEVKQQDLFEALTAQADGSLGGVFSSQVIEHLPVELQLRLLDLCHRKLRPGSPALFETINPECVFALVRNFYLDPTHVRPVPPELLQFAMESKGFKDIELVFSEPVQGKYLDIPAASNSSPEMEQMRAAVLAMNKFLFGCQDYAIIGWRA